LATSRAHAHQQGRAKPRNGLSDPAAHRATSASGGPMKLPRLLQTLEARGQPPGGAIEAARDTRLAQAGGDQAGGLAARIPTAMKHQRLAFGRVAERPPAGSR